MGYRFLDHTSEVAFEAWGGTLSELFESAAEATLRTMIEEPDSVRSCRPYTFEMTHSDLDLLLFAFLQELVYVKDARLLLLRPKETEVYETAQGWRARICLTGESLDPERHAQAVDVKAVTLHQFRVEKKTDGWWCHVILDV